MPAYMCQHMQQPGAVSIPAPVAIADNSSGLAGMSGNWPDQTRWNGQDARSVRIMAVRQGHEEMVWTRTGSALSPWQDASVSANRSMWQNSTGNNWQQSHLHVDAVPHHWPHVRHPPADFMLGAVEIADISTGVAGVSGNCPNQVSWNQEAASGACMPAEEEILEEITWTQRAVSPQEKEVFSSRSMEHSSELNHWQQAQLVPCAPHSRMIPEEKAWAFSSPDHHALCSLALVAVTTPMLDQGTLAEGASPGSTHDLWLELPLSEEGEEQDHRHDRLVPDVVNVPPRRRRHQHRGGRRRRRGVTRCMERQSSVENAIPEVDDFHLEAFAAASPVEMSKDFWAAQCIEQLDSSNDEEQHTALASLRGRVLELSFQPQGCRVIQFALQVASLGQGEELVKELHGQVRNAIESPHANHVVQKVVEVMPSARTIFVPKELLGIAVYTASHRFGCRIFCRLIEHSDTVESTALIDEILEHVDEVCRSGFGRHVMCHLMEHGSSQHKKRIVAALLSGGLLRYARHRNASYVLEQVLAFADKADQILVAGELLRDPENVPIMAASQCGCHVVRALITSSGLSRVALAHLHNAAARLEGSRSGRCLLEEFQLVPCGEPGARHD